MNNNPSYTGLPPLPQPERADPMADERGFTVGQQQQQLSRDLEREDRLRQQQENSRRNQYDRTGSRKPGFGCRLVGLGCALILLGLLVGSVYVVMARPPQIVDPIKGWLNMDLQEQEYDLLAQAPIDRFNNQLRNFSAGENKLVLDEEQLNILINRKIANTDVNIDIVGEQLKFYLDATPEAEVPLWFVVNFAVDQEDTTRLIIDGIGTERFYTPGFLNQIILDSLLSANSAISFATGNEADDFLDLIIKFDNTVTLKKLEITDGELIMTVNFSTGLENLF